MLHRTFGLLGAAALLGLLGGAVAPALAQTAPGAAPQPAKPTLAPARSKREPTAGQMAARERQKTCGAEWKVAKAGGKTGGLKWPQFWSQCNARIKGSHV